MAQRIWFRVLAVFSFILVPSLSVFADASNAVATSSIGLSGWDVGILIFREGLEALLVIALLLATLRKIDQPKLSRWVGLGAGLALIGCLALALIITHFVPTGGDERGKEAFEGLAGLFTVVAMLALGLWLHKQSKIQDWTQWLKTRLEQKSGSALPGLVTGLAFLAVAREGGETLVFWIGMAPRLSLDQNLLGLLGATIALGVIGTLILGFSRPLPLRVFFTVAIVGMGLLSLKITGQSLDALQEATWLSRHDVLGWQEVPEIGFFPSWEVLAGQVLVLGIGLWLAKATQRIKPSKTR